MEHTFVLHELPRDINIDQKVRNVGLFLLERKIMKQPVHDRIHDLWIAGDNALFVFSPGTKQKYTTFNSLSGAGRCKTSLQYLENYQKESSILTYGSPFRIAS